MTDLTEHDRRIITTHDHDREVEMIEQLGSLGVRLRIAHFTGDSSYPTEYTLRYRSIQAVGPTVDLALTAFIEALLKSIPIE